MLGGLERSHKQISGIHFLNKFSPIAVFDHNITGDFAATGYTITRYNIISY